MVQVLEAPLWGGRASVLLLLPFHVESLSRLEKLLSPELLGRWLHQASSTSLTVSLPRANICSSSSLQVSGSMGLKVQEHQQEQNFDMMLKYYKSSYVGLCWSSSSW